MKSRIFTIGSSVLYSYSSSNPIMKSHPLRRDLKSVIVLASKCVQQMADGQIFISSVAYTTVSHKTSVGKFGRRLCLKHMGKHTAAGSKRNSGAPRLSLPSDDRRNTQAMYPTVLQYLERRLPRRPSFLDEGRCRDFLRV